MDRATGNSVARFQNTALPTVPLPSELKYLDSPASPGDVGAHIGKAIPLCPIAPPQKHLPNVRCLCLTRNYICNIFSILVVQALQVVQVT